MYNLDNHVPTHSTEIVLQKARTASTPTITAHQSGFTRQISNSLIECYALGICLVMTFRQKQVMIRFEHPFGAHLYVGGWHDVGVPS